MCSDFHYDVLKAIGLGEVFSRCEGTEVGLEAINMELLNSTGVDVATGNIVLVMLEHFVGAVSLVGKKVFWGPRMSKRTRSPGW